MSRLLKKAFLLWLLTLCCAASAASGEFSFGVIAHPFKDGADESTLRKAISETDADDLAFVIVNGIRSKLESCSDKIYERRKSVFDSAKNGMIVSLSGSDWSDCKNAKGRSTAPERLSRLRDLFFSAEFSLGASKIPVLRQSASPRFRDFGENTRWEAGNILFATINFPANNNLYLAAAGRNSEFEDRQVANRDWLLRIFTLATQKKLPGIVLFADGNPLSLQKEHSGKRDGFLEVRRQITALTEKFPGKVLIVHGATAGTMPAAQTISWKKNVGALYVDSSWVKLTAEPASATLFSISDSATEASNARQ